MDKKKLRSNIIECINCLSTEELIAEDALIIAQILASDHWQKAKSIFCYIPIEKEINTYPLLENALASNKVLSVPYIYEAGKMEAKQIKDLAGLPADRFGIPSPPVGNNSICPEEIDLIIVPGIAYDKETLLRLGRGGGFYDRFLAKSNALRLAPTRMCQLVDKGLIDKKDHDLHMDLIITSCGKIVSKK